MAQGCGTPVTWYQLNPRTYREIAMHTFCGTYQTDVHGRQEVRLCEPCVDEYTVKYPQGWETYPGDRCSHGNYVGGVGFDYMCHICESGG